MFVSNLRSAIESATVIIYAYDAKVSREVNDTNDIIKLQKHLIAIY